MLKSMIHLRKQLLIREQTALSSAQRQNFMFAVIQKVRPACVTPDTEDPPWK
jgi:ABC-type oligopeptide transport system ATPase subunit